MARAKDVKAKEKKQKMILGGLGVVLLIVLAIELPGMLSSGGSTSASTATDATTATVATPPGGSPVPAANVAPAGAAVASSEVVFSTSVQKLSHLGFFKAKDPFESHGVGATPTAASTSPPAAATPTSPPAAAATGNAAAKAAAVTAGAISSGPIFGTIQGPSSQSSGPSQGAGSRSARSIPSAVIRFNGHTQTVALGASFPKKSPYFRLAGVTPNGIIISVLKGSLADGSASIELVKNRPLTLVNTATGGRFRIELRSAPKKT